MPQGILSPRTLRHSVACVGAIAVALACSTDTVGPPQEEALSPPPPALSVVQDAWVDTWLITDQDVLMDCANDGAGELTDWSGTIDVHYSSVTTPSGSVVLHWLIDYYTATPLSFTGQTSGDVWHLERAEDNGGSVTVSGGPGYVEHWQFNEFYRNQDGDRLHNRARFGLMIDGEGAVKLERLDVKCR